MLELVKIGIMLSSTYLAHGEAIQFYFGKGNGPLYSGNNAPAAISGTVWNEVVGADIPSGLLYSDETAATGVPLDAGTQDPINWAEPINSYAGGSTTPIDQTDLMNDWNWRHRDDNLGARVTGLAAGNYEVHSS